jgi:anti-sigma B factor antagonist
MAPAKLSVLVGERFACVKICGRANFSSSVEFRTLVTELQKQGYTCFVLDLAECQLMDSTFLGVLAGLGLKMDQQPKDQNNGGLTLMNPNDRVLELLESLGVLHLFKVARGPMDLANCVEGQVPAQATPSKELVTRACLEAHQTLMAINSQNVPRFKDLTQFLAEDLKRLKNPA